MASRARPSLADLNGARNERHSTHVLGVAAVLGPGCALVWLVRRPLGLVSLPVPEMDRRPARLSLLFCPALLCNVEAGRFPTR